MSPSASGPSGKPELGARFVASYPDATVRLDPPLPDKNEAALRLGRGPVIKVVLAFRDVFWGKGGIVRRAARANGFEDFAFLHDPDAAIPTWWSAMPLRVPVLTGWAGGPKARALSRRGRGAIAAEALRVLSEVLGVSDHRLRDRLLAVRTHDWQSDPWSRGAYSYVTVGGGNAADALARPLESTLYFAGEAAHADEMGTVAGALASGRRAARRIVRSL